MAGRQAVAAVLPAAHARRAGLGQEPLDVEPLLLTALSPLLLCCRDLSYNQFTGNMPDSWSVGPAFLSLVDLQVGGLAAWGACTLAVLPGCLPARICRQPVSAARYCAARS